MNRSDDSFAIGLLVVGGAVLGITQVFGVPWTVAFDAIPKIGIWLASCVLIVYTQSMAALWPVVLGSIPWALAPILIHKYQGSWLGNEGCTNTLAIVLIIGGFLFKLWRQPSYR